MPDLMAIISKAVFEKQAGKSPSVGTRLQMDRYVSANKNLAPLADGGRLYLVTVRPPDEALWLVAILDQPAHDGAAWVAKPSPIGITDISDLRAKIAFESGVGITPKRGALGMSLQTPRALTAADTALLDAAAGVGRGATDGTAGAGTGTGSAAIDPTSGVRSGGLLGVILDDPDNADAKRVYADLLAQHDDPRGELILVELALDGPLSIRKREQLRARLAALIAAHAETWWPYDLTSKRTKHGFLRAVGGSYEQLKAAAAGGLFARDPAIEVTVNLDEAEVSQLVKEPWLPRVRRLVVVGEIGDAGFAALCVPALANLRSLNVTNCGITSEGLGSLGASFGKLTTLVLTSNEIGDEGLGTLRQWKPLANLETLYLSNCAISSEGLAELLLGLRFPRLAKLTLAQNELDDDAATALAKAAARLPALRHLELARTSISEDGVKALAKAKLPALRRLDLRANFLEADSFEKDARVRV